SKLVSVGNEADLGLGEIADLLVDDAATEVILLFLESVRDAERIEAMAGRAHAAGKPIIAYKLGRSEVGAELATSHTGALAGNDAAVVAFLDAVGIIRVDTFEGLLEAAPLARSEPPPARPGCSVAVVTTSGGGGAIVVHRLGLAGLDVPAPPAELRQQLAERGIEIGPGRLIDVTMAGTRPDVYGGILEALMRSDHVDGLVAVVGSSAQFHPDLAVQPIIELRERTKPLAVFLAPEASVSARRLAAAGIANFRTPESCADAIAAVLRRYPPVSGDRPPLGDLGRVTTLLAEGADNEDAALAIFEALGIPRVRSLVLPLRPRPGELAAIDFYPVAAKVLSPEIAHKSDAGGVMLQIQDGEALAQACRQLIGNALMRHPGARIDGIIVQAMASGVAEMLIGFRRDAQVGPLAVVGMGGTLTELLADVRVARAPIAMGAAREMILKLRGAPLLQGFRGRPPADIGALSRALAAISDLARLPEAGVGEAEINPLIVGAEGEGVIAVDGLIVPAGKPSHQPTA
ncbi:MAG TPA: acetate--CoA ligase family protein, partial [Alphaproteobacteria bacterium]|nr:acetate--CoA ligase family protein [Alphaproteobacteria bacterium]